MSGEKSYLMIEVSDDIKKFLENISKKIGISITMLYREIMESYEPILRKISEEKIEALNLLREELYRTALDSLTIRALENDVLEELGGYNYYILEDLEVNFDEKSLFLIFREKQNSPYNTGDMWLQMNMKEWIMGFTFMLKTHLKKPPKLPIIKKAYFKYEVDTTIHEGNIVFTLRIRTPEFNKLPKISEVSKVIKELRNKLQLNN